ncbi:lamin tail domain-containing protein [Nocardioides sp. URHA0020]|uniref:lamin tail domain-containing protein n=1 Tax=Nocardioides sp. URHA0020 TaxID=1380392 RepID=UPI000AE12BE4|nr:lamin tail domain-containing protein [Nocardioides sp. URHA0020]
MPHARRSLSAALATSLGVLTLGVVVPPAHADTGAVIRITEIAYGGLIASGGDGEYVELTNIGDAAQDLTGWSYDNVKATAGAVSLTSLGTLAPGASAIITDADATAFRTDWGLKASVAIVNDGTETLNKGPNAVHLYDGSGAEVDSVSYVSGFFPGKGRSAWVDAAHLGAKATTTGWSIATAADAEASWTSATGSIGSPGASTHGTLTPTDVRTGDGGGAGGGGGPEAPCQTEDGGTAPGTVPAGVVAWPGSQTPVTADDQCAWVTSLSGQDLSGLAFDPNDADVLYAVKNKSHVYRLLRSGAGWVKDTANDWSAGKDLRFPGGSGLPDSEGLTVGPDGSLYVTTERDNAASGVPLDSVLKLDPTASGTTLVASDQWVLTPDLGLTNADANLGFEGVAYVPDAFLTRAGFRTDAGTRYDPAAYPGKAAPGLFLGAVEKTGHLRAYVLNTDHTFVRVADIATGMVGVMEASYDADLGRIWAHCDNTCGNATALLKVGSDGHFAVERDYSAPTGLPNYNLEGFVVAPASTATGGARQVLWADDGNRFGHSLWSGTLDLDLGLTQSLTPDPQIGGTPTIGSRLTADLGTWDDGVSTHYGWQVGDTVLATDAPLTLSDPTLVGATVELRVTGTRSGFGPVTTTATTTVVAGALTAGTPTVSGTPTVGRTLTAAAGGWGPGPVQLRYTWLADGRAIAGATGRSLRLTAAQRGAAIAVRVTGARVGYATRTATSRATAAVRSGTITTARPTIRGTARVGRTLVVRPGRWSAGGSAVHLSYRWLANGTVIRGQGTARLRLTAALRGQRITVRVVGSAAGYRSAARSSAASGRVR